MNVALISDITGGGAAVACRRLAIELKRRHPESVTWIAARGEGDDVAKVLPERQTAVTRFLSNYAGRWHTRTRLAVRHQRRQMARRLAAQVATLQPALLNLHNLHQATDFSLLSRLPHVPLVWTLHDMWPLTGYCCYSYECRKYSTGCHGDCPQAEQWGVMTTPTAAAGWTERQACLQRLRDRLSFVTPSRWLAEVAKERFISDFEVEVIPYGLDLNVFQPLPDRSAIRRCLGLPDDRPVILTGAQKAADPRKGAEYLARAAQQLAADSAIKTPVVVVFGDLNRNTPQPEGWLFTGRIRDERLLNMYYNAADVFVHPSLADNLPNTLIEAAAAGTPAVTFNIGGCPEIVRDGKTGFVAKYRDVADLAACIRRVLEMPPAAQSAMRAHCREVAVAEYDVKLMADRYAELFRGKRKTD